MNTRPLQILSAILLTTSLAAPAAWAHGGQFRGPGGRVPPGLRTPFDPPPGPIPNPDPIPDGPPITGGPSMPHVPGPTSPGSGPAMPYAPGSTGPSSGPVSTLDYTDASFWWGYNKAPYLDLKRAIYHRISTGSPITDLGRGAGNVGDNTQDIRTLVGTTILPTLLWVMDPKNGLDADTESAAYLGLAKVAREPAQIDLLKKGLSQKRGEARRATTQEAAALAFGLLRRAETSEQFTSSELDNVRRFLFDVFDNTAYSVRVRGFAALSIGLLGDQPSGRLDGSDEVASARATTSRLFDLLQGDFANEDLYVAALMAAGLQDARTVTEAQRDVLREAVLKGRMHRRDASGLIRAHAAHTLGRIGTARDIRTLQRALDMRRGADARVRRSAAIGLGELSRLLGGPDRIALAEGLMRSIERRIRDQSTRNFAYVSLGYTLRDDVHAKRVDVLSKTKAGAFLLKAAEKGRRGDRNFAALSLAIVAREIGEIPETEAEGDLRAAVFEVLGADLRSTRFSKRDRANFAVAIGIAGAKTEASDLLRLVADKNESHELRGYAALALGLMRDGRKRVKSAIREALLERRSEEMRVQCATALGLLHDRGAVDLLLGELERARSLSTKAQLVLALARIGDERAVTPLVAMVRDAREQAYVRGVACAALGIVGDMERLPSLSRISVNVNYRSASDLTREVLSIL